MGRSSDSKKHSKKSESDSSDSSRESEKARKKAKRLKRKEEKLTEKLRKIERKRLKKLKKKAKRELAAIKNGNKNITTPPEPVVVDNEEKSANVPIGLMDQSRSMAPMTKEEWEKRQSQVRRVLDEESGRYRLIKGDGEVLEEIVSQKRHREINQQATQSDGAFFQANTSKR